MAEDPPVSSDISGFPIESLIAAPVNAAVRAETLLAKATSEFINTVGFNNVNFEFERPIQDPKTGEVLSETVSVQLPLLAMVNVPSLLIQQMDVTFDIEITQPVPPTAETPSETTWPNLGPEIQILGKVTTPADHIRPTDYASRYHVELYAADRGPSEALSRVIDMMAHAVAPKQITSHPVGDQPGTPPSSDTPPGEPT
jgi:hypothetical protein